MREWDTRQSAQEIKGRSLLRGRKVHYNPGVRTSSGWLKKGTLALVMAGTTAGMYSAQEAPLASGARILLLPRKMVAGERATLAVLDVSGRLTPGVGVVFSNGDKLKTDATGRGLFVTPLDPGTIYASIEGRSGRVSSMIQSMAEAGSAKQIVTATPRVAALTDRFEISGKGFCGDADANKVSISGKPGLVLAASPAYLAILPPEMDPGPAQVQVSCGQRSSEAFTVLFVSLDLEASHAPLGPGEHRSIAVRVRGSTAKINLEARNLSPEIAELQGGTMVRVASSGGAENLARFELVGKQHGNFLISIRLAATAGPPRP